MVKRRRLPVEIVRMAVAAHPRAAIAAIEVPLRRPINIISDHQIQTAIVVVIEPRRARSPSSGIHHACPRGHIRKGAVTIVVIENAAAVTADEQVGEAIIVVVAHRDAHPEQALGSDAGCHCYVGESSITIVPVERASQRVRRSVDLRRGSVYQVEIKQSVLVVVDPAASRTHGLDQVLLRGGGVVVLESDACSAAHVDKPGLVERLFGVGKTRQGEDRPSRT